VRRRLLVKRYSLLDLVVILVASHVLADALGHISIGWH
jgi:hypothetical protein